MMIVIGNMIETGIENETENEIVTRNEIESAIVTGKEIVGAKKNAIETESAIKDVTTTGIEIEIAIVIGNAIGIAKGTNGIKNVRTVREAGVEEAIATVIATETAIEIEIAVIAAIPKTKNPQGRTPIVEKVADDVVGQREDIGVGIM